MPALHGKHALVTGGSRGIGAAITSLLLKEGAHVTILGRNEETLAAAASRFSSVGEARYVVADVAERVAVQHAFNVAAKHFGNVDILINNAGQARSASFLQTDDTLWQGMLEVNLNGAFYCMQAALPAMRTKGWGRVVNIASSAGLQGYPYVAAYCAAKHAVVGLTRALAEELVDTGVTVNAICPGYTDTDLLRNAVAAIAGRTGGSEEAAIAALAAQNPQKRLLLPEEVAQLAVQLCLPRSAALNGQALAMDTEA